MPFKKAQRKGEAAMGVQCSGYLGTELEDGSSFQNLSEFIDTTPLSPPLSINSARFWNEESSASSVP